MENLNIMLIGEYTHTIDPKKRISIPSKFRKELGKKAVVTRGLDNCLFVYTLAEWAKVAKKLSELPLGQSQARNFARIMLSGAVDADLDSLGRVLVPDYLKEYADLTNKVVITGVYNRLEIWNEKYWNEYKGKIEKQTDILAEKLGELGIL